MTSDERLAALEEGHRELTQGYKELLARFEENDRHEASAAAALSDRLKAINESIEEAPRVYQFKPLDGGIGE